MTWFFLIANSGWAAPLPLAPAVECSPRAGLPNALARLKTRGGELRIAYFGGSITAQEGWRPKTLAWFQRTYPDCKVSQINAAIGGTGSDLGVFRLRHDVLDQKPDLMFVEFAVNDGGRDPESIYRCMEGIVRQTWHTLPDCDICFVYTLVEDFVPTLQEGKFPQAASAMEKIAGHYGIPSIHMGVSVAQMVKDGKLIFTAPLPKSDEEKKALGGKMIFSPDHVHPYPETGHELYLQSIVRSLPAIEGASKSAGPHALASPFDADNYEAAKMLPITSAVLPAGGKLLDPTINPVAKQFAARVPTLFRDDHAGDVISFRFKGRYAAIYDVIGPESGQVMVSLDDGKAIPTHRFDPWSTYPRLAMMPIGSDLADGIHTARIEINDEHLDKPAILASQQHSMDDPKRFEGTAFYPGAILLVGDLVEKGQ